MGIEDVKGQAQKARNLHSFIKTLHGQEVLAVYRRACTLVTHEEKKDHVNYGEKSVNSHLFAHETERELWKELQNQEILKEETREGMDKYLKAYAALRPFVDAFFMRF